MAHFVNTGVIVNESPGAGVSQEAGSGNSVDIADCNGIEKAALKEFIDVVLGIRNQLGAVESDDVDIDIGELRESLEKGESDHAVVRRSVRNLLRTCGSALEGALGNALWFSWMKWSGLQ